MTVLAGGRHGDTKGPGFWLLPDYGDVCDAGRSARVVFAAAATAAEAAGQLRLLAAEIAANGLAGGSPSATGIGEGTEFRRETFVARLGPRLTAEVAALLLKLAANELRRAGLPTGEEWLVMTDPFEVE